MSEKNFKIGAGLDLDGLILTAGTGGVLLANSESIATQQYVLDQIGFIDIDLSAAAGAYLTWNNVEQFDVDVSGLAGELTTNYDIATQSFVTGYGFVTPVELGGYGFATESYVGTALDNALSPGGNIDSAISSAVNNLTTGDIEEGNNLYFTDARAVDAISAALGEGLSYGPVAGADVFSVDTTVIATREYVDAVAQGLDVKASVNLASTGNLSDDAFVAPGVDSAILTESGLGFVLDGDRVLLKDQTNLSQNGIYVATYQVATETFTFARADDATIGTGIEPGTLTKGAFTFVEGGTSQGKGFVVSELVIIPPFLARVIWSQFSETGNFITSVGTNLDVTSGELTLGSDVVTTTGTQDLSNKRILDTLYFSDGVTVAQEGEIAVKATTHEFEIKANYGDLDLKTIATSSGIGSNVNISSLYGDIVLSTPGDSSDAYIGSVAAGNEIATEGYVTTAIDNIIIPPAFIETVDTSFAVTDGELSLSDNITIASVELTDSVANVTAASDVFGNGSVTAYMAGSAVTVATLAAGTKVADIFLTITDQNYNSRTSKLTVVFTGGDAPTWTEYGIVDSVPAGNSPISAEITCAAPAFVTEGPTIKVNVADLGSTYAVHGVVTLLK